jgi:hypothetical protein
MFLKSLWTMVTARVLIATPAYVTFSRLIDAIAEQEPAQAVYETFKGKFSGGMAVPAARLTTPVTTYRES